jgi:hypothetical protein
MRNSILSIRCYIALSAAAVVTCSTNAALTQWRAEDGGNGHYYDTVVSPTALTWETARDSALALGGQLATLTSASEDAFVFSLVSSRPDAWSNNTFGGPWLGAYQPNPYGPADQGWVWVTGEAWSYTHWAGGEPNDAGWQGGVESYLQFRDYSGGWNDFTNDGNRVYSFVVEYQLPAPGVLAMLGVSTFLRNRRQRMSSSLGA